VCVRARARTHTHTHTHTYTHTCVYSPIPVGWDCDPSDRSGLMHRRQEQIHGANAKRLAMVGIANRSQGVGSSSEGLHTMDAKVP